MRFYDVLKAYRRQLLMAGALLLILLGIGVGSLLFADRQTLPGNSEDQFIFASETETQSTVAQETSVDSSEESAIFIDIKGAVNRPGVYQVAAGERVYELLQLAGGLTDEAAGEYLNQAQVLTDQQMIYVPTKAEAQAQDFSPAELQGQLQGTPANSPDVSSQQEKVNINTADTAQLTTLSGIGQKKAEAIIAYREENGPFKSVEELKEVSGIGEKTVEKLRPSITI